MSVYFVDDFGPDLWFQPDLAEGVTLKEMRALSRPMRARPLLNALPCANVVRTILAPPPPTREMFKHIFVSANPKTLFSINLRIHSTKPVQNAYPDANVPLIDASCRPTTWCVASCYAKAGPMAWTAPQRRALGNMMRCHELARKDSKGKYVVSDAEVDIEAGMIVYSCLAFGANNIRICGGGDLMPGLVRLMERMVEIGRPNNFRCWGFTKRPDVLQKTKVDPNIVFQLSLDPTTPGLQAAAKSRRRARVQKNAPCNFREMERESAKRGWDFCYATALTADEDPYYNLMAAQGYPMGTIFGYHINMHHTDVKHPMQCPASHPIMGAFYDQIPANEWPGLVSEEGKGSVCQVCRWCILNPSERDQLAWTHPMGSVKAFEAVASARGIEVPTLFPNPPATADLLEKIQQDLTEMHPWFSGMGETW